MSGSSSRSNGPAEPETSSPPEGAIDETDRALIAATQAGLPLVARPYHEVGRRLGLSGREVMARLRRMQAAGIVRRIGAVPNHYQLGYRANGMSVWDIPDQRVQEAGRQIGALECVSHCYHRPRRPPDWPYNLFAMVHGRTYREVAAKVARIAELLGPDDRGHETLYSTRLLKKTGLRIDLSQ